MKTFLHKTILFVMVGIVSLSRAVVADNTAIDRLARAKEIADLRFGMFICWSFSTFAG